MNILYIGDVMGEPGLRLLEEKLPSLRKQYGVDFAVAQAENVTDGKGLSAEDFGRLKRAGVDFCTGGNWTLHNPSILSQLSDPNQPVIRPANYPADTPGLGYKYADTPKGKILVISLLGKIVGKDADKPVDNPLHVVDAILESQKDVPHVATVVNFHGDFSSEKIVIGYYLDGRVGAVLGDHWHVPTADAMVLPKGTAHMTDVGMCGVLHSSLGIRTETIIKRWRDDTPSRNELETEGPRQFSAALITVDEQTGLATDIKHLYEVGL
jgi:2',3'-cyclic-nucleotide 2'-phosphodiesterase